MDSDGSPPMKLLGLQETGRSPLEFIGVHWSPVAWGPMGLLTGSSLAPEKSYIVLTDSSPSPHQLPWELVKTPMDSNGLQWTSMESDTV